MKKQLQKKVAIGALLSSQPIVRCPCNNDTSLRNKSKNNKKFSTKGGIRGKTMTQWYLGTCKTPTSYRTIKIGQTLIDELKDFKVMQGENSLHYGDFYTKQSI